MEIKGPAGTPPVDKDHPLNRAAADEPPSALIAVVCGKKGFRGDDIAIGFAEGAANARLIAAAPEFLDAAKRVLKHYDVTDAHLFCKAMEDLKAAVQKAEGQRDEQTDTFS